MGNYLNIGNDGFASSVKGAYIDKTWMISFINRKLGTKYKLICVSRPRRFGKSTAAQMLCAYYDKSCDSRELFEGLAISKDSSYEKNLNKYDVIYLDITRFISCVDDIKSTVHVLQNKVLDELRESYPKAKHADTLSETLLAVHKMTGEKFIFIIDEWDALFREAKEDEALQKEYIDFLRSLFKNSAFTDKIIETAYMTGILPIKKYGNQSAVSDFQEYTMLTPGPLAEYVGFTEEEVWGLCEQYNIGFDEMKHWYDGYSFSRIKSVYNPNSVVQAIERDEFGSYWTRTETYESLKIYIDLDMDGLKKAIIQMLGGEMVRIDAETFQNDMNNIKKKDDVLTLLVHLGYLAYDSIKKAVYIPNEEVRQEFVRVVATSKHRELVKLIQNSEHILEMTLNLNEEAVAAAIEEVHKGISAPINYNKEESLRSVIRYAYLACEEEYTRHDEMPSGHGYVDVAYIPNQGSVMPIILIGLKWNKSSKSAIKQMKDRDYPYVFKNHGVDILLVGINYDEVTKKHICKIEKYINKR